jgi:hypothetical protein
MRDDRIYEMHEANGRRTMLLLQQFEFLDTRMLAYEDVLSSWKSKFRALFDQKWLKRAVDQRQASLLATRKKAMQDAAMKPRILKAV